MSSYRSLLTAAAVQTKRGCPFECVYCTYAALEGRTYRLCEPESVARAVRSLTAAGIRDIEFVDNVFNAPREHGQAVCEALARDRHGARLQSLELSPRFLDDELLSAMESAGFVAMGVTIESAADAVLARMRKGFTAEDVRRAAEVVRRHRIPCLWILLFGGPGETEATVARDARFRPSVGAAAGRGLLQLAAARLSRHRAGADGPRRRRAGRPAATDCSSRRSISRRAWTRCGWTKRCGASRRRT